MVNLFRTPVNLFRYKINPFRYRVKSLRFLKIPSQLSSQPFSVLVTIHYSLFINSRRSPDSRPTVARRQNDGRPSVNRRSADDNTGPLRAHIILQTYSFIDLLQIYQLFLVYVTKKYYLCSANKCAYDK